MNWIVEKVKKFKRVIISIAAGVVLVAYWPEVTVKIEAISFVFNL